MKRIALVLFAMCAAVSMLAAPNATIQYCDNNRNAAVQQSMNQMNLVLPGLVDSQVGPSVDEYMRTNGIPRVITNTVVEIDVQVFSNITSDVVFHTNIIDNVISNYYTVEHNTNYIDNVISNLYTVEYYTNIFDNVISNFWSTNEHYEVYNTYSTNFQNGATFILLDTNETQGISGDLNIYDASRKSQRDPIGGYWLQMIDLYTGDVFVYESTYSSSPYKYFRYRRLNGPSITTGSSASLRYLGGVNTRFPYTFSGNSKSANCTIRVYDDSGTLVGEESPLFDFNIIDNGGYYIVGGRKMAIRTEYIIGNQVDRLVTTSMLDSVVGSISTTGKTTRLYKSEKEILTSRFNLNMTEYIYEGTTGGTASYTTFPHGYRFVLCDTNHFTTTSTGTTVERYPASDVELTYGNPFQNIQIFYEWFPSTSKGRFGILADYTPVDQLPNSNFTPEYVFTNRNMQIAFDSTGGDSMPEYDYFDATISFDTNILDTSNQYINGGLGIYNMLDERIGTLARLEDLQAAINSITNWIDMNFQRK